MTNFDRLKSRQRAIRDGFSSDFGLRIHRAISWLGRAEQETDDPDAAFLFHWITFNSAYAVESETDFTYGGEREVFRSYFDRLANIDKEGRIYKAVWTRFSGPIRLLLENRYVFAPFWKHQSGTPGYDDWEDRFVTSAHRFKKAFQDHDTVTILSMLFDRLYVLRNQLVHGAATWNGSKNRNQVRDSAAILSFLVPLFLDLMMDAPELDWGTPIHPVVEG